MNPRLEISNISKISEGKYVAHIGVVDEDADFFAPYQTINIEATNMEFASRIAEIRVEEMMSSKINGNFNETLGHKNMLMERNTYNEKYVELQNQLEELWTAQEETLTSLIKDAQMDSENGINIRYLDIKVEYDGDDPLLVYAIRNWVDDSSEWVELLVTFTGDEDDLEWCSIYDFYCGTAGKILTEIFEGL